MTSRIVIVGGGIGGLTTAVALARTGHDVVVLERAARLRGGGAGLMLAPNGMAALAEIDPALAARVCGDGHVTAPDEVRLIMDATGRVLSREPIGAAAAAHGHPVVPILREALHQALSDAALAAGARVRAGAGVTAIATVPGGAAATLADGSVERGDLVVAADGLRSVARAAFVADGPPRYSGYTSVRGQCHGGGVGGFVVNGRGVQLFVAPVGVGHYWAAKITAAEGDWPRRALPDVRAALLARRWPQPAADLLARTAAADLVVTDVHDRDPLRRWVYGRVALLGDAAHPMVPALGQGANMAIEDAAALAACLAELPEPDAALAAYQGRRCERAAEVVLASRSQGRSDQGAGRLRALGRDLAVRLRGRKDADVPALTTIGGRP